jgi:hypothetical protein
MALGDPNDPATVDPVVAQALAAGWTPPPEFFQPWNAAAPEYPMPGAGSTLPAPLPPPPPPPKDKKIGAGSGSGVEETAGPVPAAADSTIDPNLIELEQPAAAPTAPTINLGYPHPPAMPAATPPVPPTPGALQPGLGIPTSTLDNVSLPPAPTMLPPGQDPWSNTLPDGTVSAPDHISEAPPVDYYNTAELGDAYDRLQQRDPIAYTKLREQKLIERDAAITNQRTKALQADTDWMQRNMAARADAKAKADARAAQVDQEAKNLSADGGFWESRSTGQVAAAYLSAIIGGIMSVRTGRPNDAIAGINAAIERHVAAQKAKLADGRSAVSQMYQRLGDNYAADETMRIASWREVEQQLLTEQQNYDPRGVGAMRIADAAAAARAQQAAALLRYQTATQKQLEDAAKVQLERERLEETKRHARQEESIAWTGRANEKSRLGLDERRLESENTREQYRIDREQTKDVQQFALGDPNNVVTDPATGKPKLDEHGLPIIKLDNLRNADGKVWLAADNDQRKTLGRKVAVAAEINDIGNRILAIRDRVGGESSVFNSDEKQQLDVLGARLGVLAKSGTEGMSSDDDMKRLTDAVGASDVTSFRARAAGIKEGVDRTTKELNRSMRIEGKYTGKPIAFSNPYAVDAASSADDEDRKMRMKLDETARDKLLPKNLREEAQHRLDSLITQPEEPIDRGTQTTVKDTGD